MYIHFRVTLQSHPGKSVSHSRTWAVDKMGSLCSKASNYQDGHTVLDSSNSASGAAPASAPDPRTAAAEAAERRIQAVSP